MIQHQHVEMIEEYIKNGGDFQYFDNHGELVRCKDCVHWIPGTIDEKDNFNQPRCKRNGGGWSADEYCSNAEKREEKTTETKYKVPIQSLIDHIKTAMDVDQWAKEMVEDLLKKV